ncbi:hypothetical protein B0H14DRAFT_2634852 [Mycena olivaceomarginata]|nr:hypothetical protein B0H14DRAFT_2634852 [Mycena olivaceomarginata]
MAIGADSSSPSRLWEPMERRRQEEEEPEPKRFAAPGPTCNTLETMRRAQAHGKDRIDQLEAKLAEAEAMARVAQERAEHMHNQLVEHQAQLVEHQAQLVEHQAHEEQLEIQFMNDQAEISEIKSNWELASRESQQVLMAQNETIQRLNWDLADRTIENMEYKARTQAPTTPIPRQRKGRTSSFPVLRNVGAMVQIPLDPVPLPHPPASSTKSPEDPTPWVKTTIRKQWMAPKKGKPVAPENKNFWNNELRDQIYKQFQVKSYAGFMSCAPVSAEEMETSVVPGENDWRWDFSNGYMSSRWNLTLRNRLVALTLEAQMPEMAASVDREWLDGQLKTKLQDIKGMWGRLRPKAKTGGGVETTAEAAFRTTAYPDAAQTKKKSNSARDRKYQGRIKTISMTIEIKAHQPDLAQDLEAWKRLLDIVARLGTLGMSSEEEAEADFNGMLMKIYKVKVCMWRAPEITDYMRMVDKQTGVLSDQHNQQGPSKAMRVHVAKGGTGRAPVGLPKCMYSSEWLRTLGALVYQDLEVSAEEFGLLVAATSRMMQ